jgi:hypothetical protein
MDLILQNIGLALVTGWITENEAKTLREAVLLGTETDPTYGAAAVASDLANRYEAGAPVLSRDVYDAWTDLFTSRDGLFPVFGDLPAKLQAAISDHAREIVLGFGDAAYGE